MRFRDLRDLRDRAGIPLSEVARRAKLSQDIVRRAEEGERISAQAAASIFEVMQAVHGRSLVRDAYLVPDGRANPRPRP